MTIEHKFPVGSNVDVQPTFAFQPWRHAVVQKHEPYLGRPGYYVIYQDGAQKQWECHSAWVSEAGVRARESAAGQP
jgi:hypothetical protein